MTARNNKAFWEDESDPDSARADKSEQNDGEIPSTSANVNHHVADGNALNAYDKHVSQMFRDGTIHREVFMNPMTNFFCLLFFVLLVQGSENLRPQL